MTKKCFSLSLSPVQSAANLTSILDLFLTIENFFMNLERVNQKWKLPTCRDKVTANAKVNANVNVNVNVNLVAIVDVMVTMTGIRS